MSSVLLASSCAPLSRVPASSPAVPSRPLFELAGIKNILSKSLGSDNGLNIIKAAAEGLKQLSTPEDVAARRGLTVSEMFVGKKEN